MSNLRKMSKKQENKIAKEIGGKTVPASGALWGAKGDVRLDRFLIEAKTTLGKEYILNVNTWRKIVIEAIRDGLRIPLMQIDLEGGKHRIAVIGINDFIALNLDLFNYVMEEQPKLLDAKSYRVNGEFLNYLVGVDFSSYVLKELRNVVWFVREDIKFVDYGIHLVMIKWEDFLYLLERGENYV